MRLLAFQKDSARGTAMDCLYPAQFQGRDEYASLHMADVES